MAERTSSSHGFEVEPLRSVPVARISPEELVKVIGAILKFDGRASYTEDNEELTYSWTFVRTPLGSLVEDFDLLEEDGSVVTFIPDLTGRYELGLMVSTPYRDSEQAVAILDIQAAVVPYTAQLTPDMSWLWKQLSDFWDLVEDRWIFEILWSGYAQAIAADILRLHQVDYAKSIATIQLLFQRRWLDYSPRTDLVIENVYGVIGYQQSGATAFTGSSADISVGLIVSDREFVLTENTPSADAVGTDLQVFSSRDEVDGNIGVYVINSISPSGAGYVVSAATKFPSTSAENVIEGSSLLTFGGDPVVRTGVDVVAAGVEVGHYLYIQSGLDIGYHRVVKVGTPDGLLNDEWVEIDTAPTTTKVDLSFSVVSTVRASFQRIRKANTDTVYIPQNDADLTLYETSSFSGSGSIENISEILVEERHVFDALVSQRISITSGENGGKFFTISGVNSSRTGYIIGSAFTGETFPQDVTYEIPLVADITSRVLVLDGRAHEILSASLDESQPSVSEGGRGPLWVVTLVSETAPAGREGLHWRIADTLLSEDAEEDFEDLGIVAGDLLRIGVTRVDTQSEATIPCTVLGAVGSKIAFQKGTGTVEPGVEGELNDAEILNISSSLKITGVSQSPTGELVFTGEAEELQVLLTSTSFERDNYNLPIATETLLNLDVFAVKITSANIVRNTRIPVDEDVVSIPALFEYIAKPSVGEDAAGNIVLVDRVGTEVILGEVPLLLLENRDYTVGAETSVSGETALTEENSERITILLADLQSRDIKIGDSIDLLSGYDQDTYSILEVVDDETLRVLSGAGELPQNDGEELTYRITRRTPGKYLRFGENLFTPAEPAPDRFWAETTFFDNAPYIESNFGSLVNITKEQLDEFGASQASYKGVVSGLMYAWTMGPTLQNAAIGAHLLLGLPVTEVIGEVIDINDYYATGQGRIMIEDLDNEGEKTGLVRIYFYTPESGEALAEFSGLSTNPNTSRPWAVGDIVPPFTPISNGVVTADYISSPGWWRAGGADGARELQKYHIWQAAVDIRQVDSRDIGLAFDFLSAIRPIITTPEIAAVLFLLDTITIEDDFVLEGALHLFDDLADNNEATHMVDSTSDGVPLRLLDIGSVSMRSLFRGDDLVIVEGSDTVTSARGGFVSEGTLPYINDDFGETEVLGTSLVRPGDYLYVPTGLNNGRFEVVSVTDDNTLVVAEASEELPRSFDPVEFRDEDGATFHIQRIDRNPIATGSTLTIDSTNRVEDVNANFKWDGIAVDDLLVIPAGTGRGVYRITRVGVINGSGNNVDLGTRLVVDPPLSASGSNIEYRIERESFRKNPLFTGTGSTGLNSRSWTGVSGDEVDLLGIRTGDRLRALTGADEGRIFTVLEAYNDNKIWTLEQWSATESSIEVEVYRDFLDDTHDSDFLYERMCPAETVEIEILRPQSIFLTLSDFTLYMAGGVTPAAISTGTNLQLQGVTDEMFLQVQNAHTNVGVYGIEQVSGNAIRLDRQPIVNESPVTADILEDALDFSVSGDTVTSLSGTNFSHPGLADPDPPATIGGGVVPGDIFRSELGDYVIWLASGSTLFLVQSTGTTATVAGRIVRRLSP